MKTGKILEGFSIFFRTVFSTNRVKMSAEEAYALLNNVNHDSQSSCWIYEKAQNSTTPPRYDLSVILPAYNSEKWVRNAIDSVISQKTEYAFELIIINDGSTDSTKDIVDEYKNKTNVKIIHQNNKGFSGARNSGIDIAKGKYLMFVDSDDVLLPGAIQDLLNCAIAQNADIVCGNYTNLYADGKEISVRDYKLEKVNPMGNFYGMPWGKVYAGDLFKNVRFPNNYWFEDSLFPVVVWRLAKICYTIPEVVYGYYINEEGVSAKSPKSVKSIDSLYITSSLLRDMDKYGLPYDDEIYNYFLRVTKLTFKRTRNMKSDVRKAIFVLQCELKHKYFINNNADKTHKKLVKALNKYNYKKYCFACIRNFF